MIKKTEILRDDLFIEGFCFYLSPKLLTGTIYRVVEN